MNNETKEQLQSLSDNMSNLNYDEILFRSNILLRSIELGVHHATVQKRTIKKRTINMFQMLIVRFKVNVAFLLTFYFFSKVKITTDTTN